MSEGKEVLPLEIARQYLREDIEIIKLDFPMTYDEGILSEKFRNNAEIIMGLLRKDKKVAFLTLGDP